MTEGFHTGTNPKDVLHNHNAPPRYVYVGFAETAPMYHVFQCVQRDPGRRVVPHRGGFHWCSFRRYCDLPAVFVTDDGRYFLCERHAERYNKGPCRSRMMFMCPERALLNVGVPRERRQRCSLCAEYERRSA